MRDQVRDLEVVLANGEVIHTGSLATKSSSGIHLNGLFVGSEGTLGVFTELTLKVYGIPEVTMAGRASFPTVEKAVSAVNGIMLAGIPIARIELVDAESIKKLINSWTNPMMSNQLYSSSFMGILPDWNRTSNLPRKS